MKTGRQLAFDILLRIKRDGAYSNLALNQALSRENAGRQDASFIAALVYGVLERGITLDWILSPYLKRGVAGLDTEVHIILRMGLYQLCFMEGVPDMAAVNESVQLAGYARKTSAKGLVNAVLRSFIREGKPLRIVSSPKTVRELSVAFSCPEWMVKLWENQYDFKTAAAIAEASLGRPALAARVNTLKISAAELADRLRERGVTAVPHDWLADCLLLSSTGGIESLPEFREGLFHIQDVSSQMAAAALAPQPGNRLLDCCSAPGSKSFTLAQQMENRGQILACDLYLHRLRLIEEGAKRLGISIIQTRMRDGAAPDKVEEAAFDCVLCDVPCSGLGVIRRKPEIKEHPPESLDELPELQLKILQNAAKLVKPSGRLVYSTCTLNKKENEGVISRFLEGNFSFKPLQLSEIFDKIKRTGSPGTTILPGEFDGDGFFIALLVRED